MSEALNHAAEAAGRIGAPSRRTLKWSRELSLLTVIILVVIAVGAYDRSFVAEQNLRFMILNSVVLSLVALGQTLVIATRGIDLSVAPILGLGAVVPGLLAQLPARLAVPGYRQQRRHVRERHQPRSGLREHRDDQRAQLRQQLPLPGPVA